MEKTKVAVIGLGSIAQLVHLPNLVKMSNVNLVSVAEINSGRLNTIADKFNIKERYTNYNELLEKSDVDAVIIATPTSAHKDVAVASLKAKKDVLVEKPLARTYNEGKSMVDAAKKNKKKIMVGMNLRYRPDAMILRSILGAGEIGDPFYVKCGWLRRWGRQPHQLWMNDRHISGGGVMMDMGIQLIDLALWLMGKPGVKSVRSFLYNIFENSDVEDSGLVVIETADQVVITTEVSWRMHLEKDMNYTHVFGKQGGAFMNPLRLFREMHGNLVNVTPVYSESSIDVFKNSFELEIRNFIEVIKGKTEPVTPAGDGPYIMRIMDAIYESARTGRQIDLEG